MCDLRGVHRLASVEAAAQPSARARWRSVPLLQLGGRSGGAPPLLSARTAVGVGLSGCADHAMPELPFVSHEPTEAGALREANPCAIVECSPYHAAGRGGA
jgi:hypothetical protein